MVNRASVTPPSGAIELCGEKRPTGKGPRPEIRYFSGKPREVVQELHSWGLAAFCKE